MHDEWQHAADRLAEQQMPAVSVPQHDKGLEVERRVGDTWHGDKAEWKEE